MELSGKPKCVDLINFKSDDSTRVALLSITAANSGLTLTAAHLVKKKLIQSYCSFFEECLFVCGEAQTMELSKLLVLLVW